MLGQRGRIGNAGAEHGGGGPLGGLHHPYHRNVLSSVDQVLKVSVIFRPVSPQGVGFVILIIIGGVDQFEGNAQKVAVLVGAQIVRGGNRFPFQKLLDHIVQLHRVPQAQGVEHKVADAAPRGEHHHTFIVPFRPTPRFYLILILIQIGVFRHLVKHIGVHHRGHKAVGIVADS